MARGGVQGARERKGIAVSLESFWPNIYAGSVDRAISSPPQVGGAGGAVQSADFNGGSSGTARSAVRTSSSGRLLACDRHVLCPVSYVGGRSVGRGDSLEHRFAFEGRAPPAPPAVVKLSPAAYS
jgi:hypothetical protein